MKKILLIIAYAITLIISSLLFSFAYAKDGVYVGADLLKVHARYKLAGLKFSDPLVDKKNGGNSVGVGVSLGYKKSLNDFFLAPELFYDYLNSSTKDYWHNSAPFGQDSLELRSRYGARLNIGYNFTDKFSTYVAYGVASIDHIDNFPSSKQSYGRWKDSAIYGVGIVYNFTPNWGIKAEYNTQRFNVLYEYDQGNLISKVRLNVFKTGVIYNF